MMPIILRQAAQQQPETCERSIYASATSTPPRTTLAVLEQVYPTKEPPAKTRFFLEKLLGGSAKPLAQSSR